MTVLQFIECLRLSLSFVNSNEVLCCIFSLIWSLNSNLYLNSQWQERLCVCLINKTASLVLPELEEEVGELVGGGEDGRGMGLCAWDCVHVSGRLGLAFSGHTVGPPLFLATDCYNCCLVRPGARCVSCVVRVCLCAHVCMCACQYQCQTI